MAVRYQQNTDTDIFQNACAIRMSYALNYSGVPIYRDSRWSTSSGADQKWYIFKVNDLDRFLESNLGKPDLSTKSTTDMSQFNGVKGL